MFATLLGSIVLQLHHAAITADRQDMRDTQLRRFLHDEIHALSPRHALQQLRWIGRERRWCTGQRLLGIVVQPARQRRLGLGHRIDALIDPSISLHAVGQGALGIECREDANAPGGWIFT